MTKKEFLTAYILARAGAISGSVTADKLVASAAKVWQEIQYETGAATRPVVVEHQPADNVYQIGHHPLTGEIFDDVDDGCEIGQ